MRCNASNGCAIPRKHSEWQHSFTMFRHRMQIVVPYMPLVKSEPTSLSSFCLSFEHWDICSEQLGPRKCLRILNWFKWRIGNCSAMNMPRQTKFSRQIKHHGESLDVATKQNRNVARSWIEWMSYESKLAQRPNVNQNIYENTETGWEREIEYNDEINESAQRKCSRSFASHMQCSIVHCMWAINTSA